MLVAMLDGIARQIEPPPPIADERVPASTTSCSCRARSRTSLDAFEADEALRTDAFHPEFVQAFLALKRHEIAEGSHGESRLRRRRVARRGDATGSATSSCSSRERVPPVSRARADVLIVGAGAAGGVVGRRLAEAGIGRASASSRATGPTAPTIPGRSPTGSCRRMRQWSPDPNVRGGPADYPIDVSAVRHRAADVQRRRRLDGALRRRLAPHDAVGLPRQIARRRRRRLAADVRGARAVLRPHRAPGRRRRVWPATRPTRRAPISRCRRCRSATASSTSCARTTGSAGTGGRRRARSSPRRTRVAIRARSGARACRAAPRARRHRPTSRTGRRRSHRGARVRDAAPA